MKFMVYSERIKSLEHLEARIRQEVSSIDTATLSNVCKKINTRTNYVGRQEGKHIEQIKFYVKLNDLC